MSDPIRVQSTAPFAITISEPMPKEFVDKPGLAPPLKTGVIRPGINDIDPVLWKAYSGTDPKPDYVTNGLFVEAPDESEDEVGAGFGFEPALQAASSEGASDGSSVKAAGPVSSADMKPTSTAPADDSPRSQPPSPATPVAAPISKPAPTK